MPQDINCSAMLILQFASPREAERVARALEPDNAGFMETALRGRTIEVRTSASSIPSMLHTLDDYLACLGIAEGLKGAP